MEEPQHSRKRTWQQTQQSECTDPKLIEAKRILRVARSQPGLKGRIVLMHPENQSDASSILHLSANALQKQVVIRKAETTIECDTPTWNLYLGDEIVASGEYADMKTARAALIQAAVDELKRYCFTVVRKGRSGDIVEKDGSVQETKPAETPQTSLSLGEKMMAKMGWTGGGLGAQEQGIVNIIQLQEQINRLGLGADNIVGKVSTILADFAKTCSIKSLIFSKEYTKDQRKQIHQLAMKYNLKSKSSGKGEDRHLIVSCRLDSWHLVEKIMEEGGETNDYKLIYPTDL